MSSDSANYGIHIDGSSTVVAGAMAAGPGAKAEGTAHYSATAVPADLHELRAALSDVVERLRASPPGVDDPDSLAEVASSAQREASKDKPSKNVLGGLLQALMAGVSNSAVLANAVLAIQHAVSVLL